MTGCCPPVTGGGGGDTPEGPGCCEYTTLFDISLADMPSQANIPSSTITVTTGVLVPPGGVDVVLFNSSAGGGGAASCDFDLINGTGLSMTNVAPSEWLATSKSGGVADIFPKLYLPDYHPLRYELRQWFECSVASIDENFEKVAWGFDQANRRQDSTSTPQAVYALELYRNFNSTGGGAQWTPIVTRRLGISAIGDTDPVWLTQAVVIVGTWGGNVGMMSGTLTSMDGGDWPSIEGLDNVLGRKRTTLLYFDPANLFGEWLEPDQVSCHVALGNGNTGATGANVTIRRWRVDYLRRPGW